MTIPAAQRPTPTTDISTDVMRDALYAATNNVHTSCLVNTSMLQHYHGGPLPTVTVNGRQVLATFGAIHQAQMSILCHGHIIPQLTLENTEHVANNVHNTLQHSVPGTARALVSKQAELKAASLTEIVKHSLELLLRNHEDAGEAVTPHLDHSDEALTAALKKQVADATAELEDAVKVFSSPQ